MKEQVSSQPQSSTNSPYPRSFNVFFRTGYDQRHRCVRTVSNPELVLWKRSLAYSSDGSQHPTSTGLRLLPQVAIFSFIFGFTTCVSCPDIPKGSKLLSANRDALLTDSVISACVETACARKSGVLDYELPP